MDLYGANDVHAGSATRKVPLQKRKYSSYVFTRAANVCNDCHFQIPGLLLLIKSALIKISQT